MRNWMETSVPRRLLSLALSAAMVFSLLPVFAFAEETDGLCRHHPAHTPECGYVAAVEGQDCAHVCGDDCFTLTTACTHVHGAECYSDGVLPNQGEEKTADACTHVCSEESGCVTKTPACVHTAHDETCGYVAAVEGQPCGFVCQECAGEPQQDPAAKDWVVTDWQWIDEDEVLDEETGGLALPGASAQMPAYFVDVVSLLPWEITAAVDGKSETLTVDWVCDDYPESGAYEGEYIFTALLPEGYVLAEGVSALTVNVLLGGGETYATVSQIPYLTFDTWKVELVSAQCDSATLVTSKDTKWTAGWYVARGDLAINSRVEIDGDVNLILEDGCSLTVNGGIRVFGSNALYIYAQSEGSSMGRLIAESVTNGLSGIGGNQAEEVGTIHIDGGNITATGKEGGAGIGAGGSIQRTGSTGGFIRICGGIVNATGGLQAAGIGGGPDGKDGRIYIFGGTVIAHNGDRAACIGDGTVYWDNGGCKISIIGDATVIADVTITNITKRGTGIGTYNKQISDTFTCGASSTGVAPVIITSGIGANNTSPPENGYSISDTGHGYEWKGLIFEGDKGTIYGMDSFTLRKDLTIPSISGGRTLDVGAGKTLTVASGKTLTIPSGVTLAVNGTLINNGNIIIQNGGKLTLNGNMTVANGGSLTLNGSLANTGSLVFESGASVSGTGTYTGSDTSPSLQGAVVLEGKYLHIHVLKDGQCACGYSIYTYITVSGIKAVNKTYDGTKNATLDYSGVTLNGVKANHKVSVTATGTFADKNVGSNKPVTISNLTLSGADASKYRLASSGQQTTATASITAKPVTATVTVASKTYDGTTAATVSAQVTQGVLSGDSITITGLTGTFENASAGTNKTVTVNAASKSITGSGSGNYAVAIPATAKGTINKAQAVITVETGKTTYSKTYGDDPFQLTGITENSDDAEGVTYAVTAGADVVSVSDGGMVTILKAGDATITLSLPESSNYLAAKSVDITIHVVKKDSTVSITGNPGKTYDGQPAVLTENMYTATGDGTVTVAYKVKGAADSTYSSDAPTNAGEYTVRVTQAAGTNYAKAEQTANFTISPKAITVTITPGGGTYGGTISPATAAANDLVGSDQVPVTLTYTGTANDGTVVNGTATPTQAGTYTVTATISNSNYQLTGTTTAQFVVEKATVTTPTLGDKVFNGSVQTADVPESTLYTVYKNEGGTVVDEYAVELTLTDSHNYKWDDNGGKTTFRITKLENNSWTTEPGISDWIYGDTASTPTAAAKFGTVKVEYTSDGTTYSTTAPTNAGSYKARFTVADTNNFAGLSAEKDFTIEKASLTVTAKDHAITYGDAPGNNGVEYSGFVNSEDASVLGGTLAYTYDYSQYGDVGSYTITPSGLTSGNYNITFADGTLTVEQLEIGIEWGNVSLSYTGTAQAPAATATGLVRNDECTITVTGQQTDAGDYTATAASLSNGNYKLPENHTCAFSITKVAPTFTAPTARDLTYYGQPLELVTAGSTSDGTMVYSLDGENWSESIPTGINAGSYTVWYKVQGDNNHEDSTPQSVSVTIQKKDSYFGTYPEPLSGLIYNGQAQSLVAAGSTSDGTLVYSLTQHGAYTSDLPTGTNAGSYTVWYKIIGDDNHKDSNPASVDCSIAQKSLTITAKDHTITYGDAPGNNGVEYSGFVNGEDASVLGGTLVCTYDYSQYGDVGSYTITPSGLTSGNYNITFVDGTLTVQKKEIGITWDNTQLTYSGSAQMPTATPTGLVNNDAITLTVSGAQTNAGSDYTATVDAIVGAKAGNYALPQSVTTPFSIAKKEVTIEGATVEATKVYDGNTTAQIISNGTLSDNFDDGNLTIVPGSAVYDSKNVGENKTVTFSGFSLSGSAKDNYELVSQPVSVMADITAKEVTITGTAVAASKVYDGKTVAEIDSYGTLKDTIPGDTVSIGTANAAAAYSDKNVGTGKTVTFSGFKLDGDDKDNYVLTAQPASVTANITPKPVTLVITVVDKLFDGTTDAEFVTTLTEDDGFVEGDKVEIKNGEAEFAHSYPGDNIAVSFTPFTLTGEDAGNYSITNPQPENVTGSIKPSSHYLDLKDNGVLAGQDEVWVDGVEYPVLTDDSTYVALPEKGDLLTIYTYKKGNSDGTHENYPTGMAVYKINRAETGATLEKIDELDNLLQYSGSSIRITGKRGIRMITSLTKGNKSALTGSGLAGYTLEEYGTVVQWADALGVQSLTLDTGKSNYAYKKGVADPVFNTSGDLIQYTNVLVWNSLTDAQLAQDIVMRPYIILKDGSGNTVTLYGGTVSRSIGYIAYQNRSVFNPGTAAYKYVWDIIHAVYGDQYDSDYKG